MKRRKNTHVLCIPTDILRLIVQYLYSGDCFVSLANFSATSRSNAKLVKSITRQYILGQPPFKDVWNSEMYWALRRILLGCVPKIMKWENLMRFMVNVTPWAIPTRYIFVHYIGKMRLFERHKTDCFPYVYNECPPPGRSMHYRVQLLDLPRLQSNEECRREQEDAYFKMRNDLLHAYPYTWAHWHDMFRYNASFADARCRALTLP